MQNTIATRVKIKIIQPQLNSEDGWIGEYRDNVIIFNVRDHNFMDKVFKGEISFKAGDFILCDLALLSIFDEELKAIKHFEMIVGSCELNKEWGFTALRKKKLDNGWTEVELADPKVMIEGFS